jgi:spore coat polysaccharide biosynthesis predicted glycosyltransferase SpsG
VAPPSIERVTVVVGPHYRGNVAALDCRFLIVHSATDMYERMRTADLAILSAGVMLHEALAVGLPALLVELTPVQAQEARAAHARGAAFRLGPPRKITPAGLAQALATFAPYGPRRRMSTRALHCFGPSRMDALVAQLATACIRRRARG